MSIIFPMNEKIDKETCLLEEYKVCESIIHHLDGQNWTAGSILLGSALASTAFVTQQLTLTKLLLVSCLSTVMLVGWRLVAWRNHRFMVVCFARMSEIEDVLHLRIQHYMNASKRARGISTGWGTIVNSAPRAFTTITAIIVLYLTFLWGFTIAIWLRFISY